MGQTGQVSLTYRGLGERQIVVMDTETTGFGHTDHPPRRDGVVQVGLAYRLAAGDVRIWSEYSNPGEEFLRPGWADEALAVNGLNRDQILASEPAKTVAIHLKRRLDAIRQESGSELDLRAYNLEFDGPFLTAEPWRVPSGLWGPCIMKEASRHLDGPDAPWVGLKRAISRLGLAWPRGPAHDAGVDSHAALLVLEALVRSPSGMRQVSGSGVRHIPKARSWSRKDECQFCESEGPHDGDHGYIVEGDFVRIR